MKELPETLRVGRDLLYSLSPLAPARQRDRITDIVHCQSPFLLHGEATSPRFVGKPSHGISPLHGTTCAQTTPWSAGADTVPGSHLKRKVATCDQRCPVPAGQEEEWSHEQRRGRVFWEKNEGKRKNQTWKVTCVPPWIGSSTHFPAGTAFSSR